MESRKRKLPQNLLGRRVRVRAEPEPNLHDFQDETDGSAPSEEERGSESGSDSGDEGEPDEDEASSDEDEEEDLSADASKVTFGALAKAQAMLPQSGRRKKKGKQEESDSEEADDGDRDPNPGWQAEFFTSTKRDKAPARSSKHAPMEMTSKRPVGRKREILTVKKPQARDPRFDPLVTGRSGSSTQADEDHARRAYAFLDEYRDDEMRQLRAAVKKARTPAEKEKLQRALLSMESRKKSRDRKDKERAVIEEHRRHEKELVKEGKKARPFYLKKSEQKKRLLVDQFTGMSERQRDKAIERRRKKVAGKEKKELPMERRVRDE